MKPPRRSSRGFLTLCVLGVIVAIAAAATLWFTRSPGWLADQRVESFPTVDTGTMTSEQQQLLTVLEQEFNAGDPGTKYVEGVTESWCADFVSWTMNRIGRPFSNPNSGSWRIPGVYTLQEYYQSTGTFVNVDQNYRPKFGDTVLYDSSSPFGQHVNIVLDDSDGVITTIGGNEGNQVMIHRADLSTINGIVGFGTF